MRYIILLLIFCTSCSSQPNSLFYVKPKLVTVQPQEDGIHFTFDSKRKYKRILMMRSHYNFTTMDTIDVFQYPVSEIELDPNAYSFTDSLIAPNLTYHYLFVLYTKDGKTLQSKTFSTTYKKEVTLPQKFKKLNIHVDKLNYILELRDSNRVVKRYPISLGQNPFGRKIEKDYLSTPEGMYHCNYLKPKSQFYKAIGVNYPTNVDRKRFAKAIKEGTLYNSPPNIGGSIQIHGGGIGHNWTFGCMAMRNSDIDELYKVKVKAYTPIFITGSEITRDSLPY